MTYRQLLPVPALRAWAPEPSLGAGSAVGRSCSQPGPRGRGVVNGVADTGSGLRR